MNYMKQISTTNSVWCPWGQGTAKLMNSLSPVRHAARQQQPLGCRSNTPSIVWEGARASPRPLSTQEHSAIGRQ